MFFSFFIIFLFFIIVYHLFFDHVSSFLLPVVQKFYQKWKITIFLEFFHFLIIVLSFFIMFHHFCFQWCMPETSKNQKMVLKNDFKNEQKNDT